MIKEKKEEGEGAAPAAGKAGEKAPAAADKARQRPRRKKPAEKKK